MEKTKDKTYSSIIFSVAILFISLLNKGGFFEGAIIFSGLLLSYGLIWIKKERLTISQGLLLIFSLWYFFCSVKNGFVTEYVFKGMLPLSVFLFSVVCKEKDKNSIIDIFLKISVWIAIVGIIQAVYISVQQRMLFRLEFPFGYANVCGIFYSVCALLCYSKKQKYFKFSGYVFTLATLLTFSVGAIGIFVSVCIAFLLKKKRYVYTLLSFVAIILCCFIFKARVIESLGTFTERILQIYDGLICIVDNPVTGIGAGSWEFAKHLYQTGFYSSALVHSSFIQIGVDSGFTGLILFTCTIVFAIIENRNNKKLLIPVLMLLVHSLLDLTLSFISINFMLALLLKKDSTTVAVNKKFLSCVISVVFALVFTVASYGMYSITNVKNNVFAQNSVNFVRKTATDANKIKQSVLLKELKYNPVEIVINKSFTEGEEFLIRSLESQPYNSTLRTYIKNNCSEAAVAEAEKILQRAINNLSLPGRILYNLKGENL